MRRFSAFRLIFCTCLIAAPAAFPVSAQTASAQPAPSNPKTPKIWTLHAVLEQVSKDSPAIRAAQAGVNVAKAKVGQARAHEFGSVDLYAVRKHYNVPMLTQPIIAFPPPRSFGQAFSTEQLAYGIEASLPLDFSGQIAAEVDAARAASGASRFSARNVMLQTLNTSAAVYRNIQALEGKRQALQDQLKALRESRAAARTAVTAGLSTRLKLLRVESGVDEVRAGIAGVAGKIVSLKAELAALMGVQDWRGRITSLVKPPAPYSPASGAAPFLHAAEQAATAAGDKVSAARRNLFPKFFLQGRWNKNGTLGFHNDFYTSEIQFGVKLNLWAGGGQVSAIDAAQAGRIKAEEKLRGARLKLAAIRVSAQARWHAEALVWRANKAALKAAIEAAHRAQGEFKVGLISATELLQAEAALARARAAVVTTLARWWEADDALRYAEGLPPQAFFSES